MNALYTASFVRPVVLLLFAQKEDQMSCIASCFASLQQHYCIVFFASSAVYQSCFANIGAIKTLSLFASLCTMLTSQVNVMSLFAATAEHVTTLYRILVKLLIPLCAGVSPGMYLLLHQSPRVRLHHLPGVRPCLLSTISRQT